MFFRHNYMLTFGPPSLHSFVYCYQTLVSEQDGRWVLSDKSYTQALLALSEDRIVDVRIALARLVGVLCQLSASPPPLHVLDLTRRLQNDESREVRSFVPERLLFAFSTNSTTTTTTAAAKEPPKPFIERKKTTGTGQGFVFATFSRPPPVSMSVVGEGEGEVAVSVAVAAQDR